MLCSAQSGKIRANPAQSQFPERYTEPAYPYPCSLAGQETLSVAAVKPAATVALLRVSNDLFRYKHMCIHLEISCGQHLCARWPLSSGPLPRRGFATAAPLLLRWTCHAVSQPGRPGSRARARVPIRQPVQKCVFDGGYANVHAPTFDAIPAALDAGGYM